MTLASSGCVTGLERTLAAAVFDLDGVVTLTARVHFLAWKQLFDELMRTHPRRTRGLGVAGAFDEQAYHEWIDGRPRLDGLRAYLDAAGVSIPDGSPDDPAEADTIAGLARRKNGYFLALLEKEGPEVDASAVSLIRELRDHGVRIGLVSSSKNASAILRRTGLERLFDARVDGVESERIGLRGKPQPDIMLECNRRLGDADPSEVAVFEDAAAGIAAARAGGFGLVVGIDRGQNRMALRERGADWIIRDFRELDYTRIVSMLNGLHRLPNLLGSVAARSDRSTEERAMNDGWTLVYEGLDAHQVGLREALCTLGNGKFATRGAAEERSANGIDYPGTYMAGVYNALTSEVSGHQVVLDSLVNVPNWLWLTFRFEDGEWLDLRKWELLEYRQSLHLDEGTLVRSIRVRDRGGRVTRIESRRLVHMVEPHLAAIEWRVVAENWSGRIVIRSGIDGAVVNDNVASYRRLANRHLETVSSGTVSPEGVYLIVRTNRSQIRIAEAVRTRVCGRIGSLEERRVIREHPQEIAEDISFIADQGEEIIVEKAAALFTSKDFGIQEPGMSARLAIMHAPSFLELYESHRRAWKWLWHRHDVEVDTAASGSEDSLHDQLVLRLHLFHVLQTCSPNTVGLDVGVPARGLHGEAYRGHVFWDDLFVLPLLIARAPSIARSAILYRYRRLDAARAIARELGYAGACFPWQSSSDGQEATEQLRFEPSSRRWEPDYSRLQRHVSAAVAYNTWRYLEATGDRAFLEEYGAELILEVARFWSSIAALDPKIGRYEIAGVMGPDEYHEKYPDAVAGGLKNNAYTNIMAVWCLMRGLDVLGAVGADKRRELVERFSLDDAELGRWRDISERMVVPFHDGVISQFEGYEALEELDWASYRARYGDIQRIDRILRSEGKSPDRYQVSKQPDVTMLFFLLSRQELGDLFQRLGYRVDDDLIRRNVEYYQARTSHGSTLSKVAFTSIVHRQDAEQGCRFFLSALRSDLYDVQGGTTPEGVHLGAMAGTVDIVVRHYGGLELSREGVRLSPDLPDRMHRVRFRASWRNRWLDVEVTAEQIHVSADADENWEIPIQIHGVWHQLAPGQTLVAANVRLAQTRQRPPITPDVEERLEVDGSRLRTG